MGFRARSLALLAVATAALGGCTAVSDPASSAPPASTASSPAVVDPSPSSSPSPSPSMSPTPTPTPVTATTPASCEALLPVAFVSETEGEAWYDSAQPVDAASSLPGPSAREAAAVADKALACRWWPERATENYLLGYAFELDAGTRATLVRDLERAASYSDVEIEGADAAFSAAGPRGEVARNTLYAFVGDVWIVLIAPATPIVLSVFAEEAVAGALAAG
ncbi:MAG: hypothetical protein P0Y48_12755 [Candidatus Microbacterium phytovorans]|uniref:DUF3558 domain-containing protein n=1 Tax=Candidatus Microbacterium phytovorans TaxID=3121374 RepID=A0AAJ5W145_9MICO|nr:hypothetical protein [Microbacterium sp.]WEK13313.1 MAG: hypothetical protein P0Y48_12755 [Microbacterium sp.]